jgi:hypothetical protein
MACVMSSFDCVLVQLKAMQTARVILTLEANQLQSLQQQQQQQQSLCADSDHVLQSTSTSSSSTRDSSRGKADAELAVREITWCHVSAPFAAAAVRAVFRYTTTHTSVYTLLCDVMFTPAALSQQRCCCRQYTHSCCSLMCSHVTLSLVCAHTHCASCYEQMREEAEEVVILLCRFHALQQLACHRVAAALTLALTPPHKASAANNTTAATTAATAGSTAKVSTDALSAS